MKVKAVSIILLIASIIWLLIEFYWMTKGFIDGWLNFFDDPVVCR